MEKEFENIIRDKSYHELTTFDKSNMAEWFTCEEEFEQLKSVFTELDHFNIRAAVAPSEKVKASLDSLFEQKAQLIPKVIWYNAALTAIYPSDKKIYQRPLIQVAAIALLIFTIYPIFKNNVVEETPLLAKVESKLTPKTEVKNDLEITQEKKAVEQKDNNSPESINQSNPASVLDAAVPSNLGKVAATTIIFEEMSVASTNAGIVESDVLITPNHSDGVFNGSKNINYSIAASSQPDMFDLLATTF